MFENNFKDFIAGQADGAVTLAQGKQDYAELYSRYTGCVDALRKRVSAEEWSIYEDIECARNLMSAITGDACYEAGFLFGLALAQKAVARAGVR